MLPVYLIGFMGTGKSTLGRALSLHTGYRFVDLDTEAERLLGATASEAFLRGDAESFRRTESRALEALAGETDVIVACGGGTPCRESNMELMLGSGTVVRLTASRERLLRRLEEAAGQRPLLAGYSGAQLEARVDELMAGREAAYSRAHRIFDATYLENEAEIEATCRRFIEEILSKQNVRGNSSDLSAAIKN